MATLKIGCGQYDTTRSLFDGTISIDGFDAQMHSPATLPEIFAAVMLERRYDVSELRLTFYLRARELAPDHLPYVAIPVFPARIFRHSSIFVNADSGIEGPADLIDRIIGEFGVYGQDAGVWAKGVLMDEYGFRPDANRWVIGGLDSPAAPFDFSPRPHPSDVEVMAAPPDASLSEMLDDGRIDALFTANVPQCAVDGSKRIRRLFPDYESAERDYHRRTGIFPMMHTVVIARDVIDSRPDVVRAVFNAFARAKDAAAERYRQGHRFSEVATMVPWMNALFERNRAEFAEDWWPYGLAANRGAIDTFLRYHHEQGLTEHRWTADDIFVDV